MAGIRGSTVCKLFVWPHLDYDCIIYGQAYTNFFQNKILSIQYNAALAITGAIRGSSRQELYQE